MTSDAGLLKTPLEAEAGWTSLVPEVTTLLEAATVVHSATNDPDCGLKVLSEYESLWTSMPIVLTISLVFMK